MASPSSKEEQLARIRRNQQRSREKKRAHIVDLESRVEDLQDRLRQCSPCSPGVTALPSLEQLQRENAARRDMLLLLGWTESMQQQFIDSFDPSSDLAVLPANAMDLETSSQTAVGSSGTMKAETSEALFPLHFTDLPPTALGDDTVQPDVRAATAATQWAAIPPPLAPNSVSDLSAPSSNAPNSIGPSKCLAAFDAPVSQCFLEAAVKFRPGSHLTACSEAIQMILRNNRKGLSLSQLHERLRPGLVTMDESNEKCAVQDDVLFKLLADISTPEPMTAS